MGATDSKLQTDRDDDQPTARLLGAFKSLGSNDKPRSIPIEIVLDGRPAEAVRILRDKTRRADSSSAEFSVFVKAMIEGGFLEDAERVIADADFAGLITDSQAMKESITEEREQRKRLDELTAEGGAIDFERRTKHVAARIDQMDRAKILTVDREGIQFGAALGARKKHLWSNVDKAHFVKTEMTYLGYDNVKFRFIQSTVWIRFRGSKMWKIIDVSRFAGAYAQPDELERMIWQYVSVEDPGVETIRMQKPWIWFGPVGFTALMSFLFYRGWSNGRHFDELWIVFTVALMSFIWVMAYRASARQRRERREPQFASTLAPSPSDDF